MRSDSFYDRLLCVRQVKAIPIRIASQTAWEAVRNDFIENKEKMASKDY